MGIWNARSRSRVSWSLLSTTGRPLLKQKLAGQPVKLDLYDGMWHVFQFFPIEGPEAMQARTKTCEFIHNHLGNG